MIIVKSLTKEFKLYKRKPGLMGAIKGLGSRETIIKKAVDNISFHVDKGEVLGYIGTNGAGKSTSIKIMTGIMTPSLGSCTVNGIVPYENRKLNASQIGVVFGQRTQLWWDLPLSESFNILRSIYNIDYEDYKNRINFLDDVLEFNKFINNPVRTLSLGERMKADLAVALIHNPKVLFLDEPTIGLDIIVKEKVRQAIKEINKTFKTTILLTTHDLKDIDDLCNRIIIIDEGKKILDDNLKKIKDEYGYMRRIEFIIQKGPAVEINEIDLIKHFNVNRQDIHMKKEDEKIIIQFNNNNLNVSDVIAFITTKFVVKDLHIYDTSIDDIIKKIYTR